MALLFVTCGRWREEAEGTTVVRSPKPTNRSAGARLVYATLGLVIAALAPALAHNDAPSIEPSMHANPPAVSLPWMPTEAGHYAWRPHFENSSAEFVQSYQSDQGVVKVFVAYHSDDHAGTRLSGADRALVREPWWITGRDQRTVLAQGQSTTVRETCVDGPSTSLVVWNWYWVDGRFAKSDYWARLYLAQAGLFGRSRQSVAIAIATENRPGSHPQAVLQNFLLHLSVPAPAAGEQLDVSASNAHP
jgi:EpsI family protein